MKQPIFHIILDKLELDPGRSLELDPVDPEVITELVASIKEDGFWGGVVINQVGKKFYVIAGWNRIVAALKAGVKTADLYVVENLSEEQIIRICARENETQRSPERRASAHADIVARQVKLLARQHKQETPHAGSLLPGQTATAAVAKGIGAPAIEKALDHTLSKRAVVEGLAEIKKSGVYEKIIKEVAAEIGPSTPAIAKLVKHASRPPQPMVRVNPVTNWERGAKHLQAVFADRVDLVLPAAKALIRYLEEKPNDATFTRTTDFNSALASLHEAIQLMRHL